jgi:hypothetical protein
MIENVVDRLGTREARELLERVIAERGARPGS